MNKRAIIQAINDEDIYDANIIDKAIFSPLSIKPSYKEDIGEYIFEDITSINEHQQAYLDGFEKIDTDKGIGGNPYIKGSVSAIAWMKGSRDRLNDEISKLENDLDGDEAPVIEEQPFKELLEEFQNDRDMDFFTFCIALHSLNPYPPGYEYNIFEEFLNNNINHYVDHSNEDAL